MRCVINFVRRVGDNHLRWCRLGVHGWGLTRWLWSGWETISHEPASTLGPHQTRRQTAAQDRCPGVLHRLLTYLLNIVILTTIIRSVMSDTDAICYDNGDTDIPCQHWNWECGNGLTCGLFIVVYLFCVSARDWHVFICSFLNKFWSRSIFSAFSAQCTNMADRQANRPRNCNIHGFLKKSVVTSDCCEQAAR